MAYLLAFAIGAWLLCVTWCGVVPGGITVWGKSEAGQKMRPGQRILFGVGGILIFGLGILLFLFRYQESFYSTLADADKVGAITRGWIPDDILPSNSRNVHEVHNPSSPSTEWCSFEFPPADSEILRRRLKSIDVMPISVRFVPIPGGAWWPSVLTGNLEVEKIHKSGLQLYIVEKPETSVTTEILLFAIDWPKGRGFFYRTRESAPVPGVPVAARSPKPIKDVYSVEDLLANPQDFAHTMVKVSGCFWSDVGHVTDNAVSLLQQCGRAWSTPSVQRDYKDFYDHVISVDDAELRYQMNRLKLNARDPDELEELKRLPIEELLFDYNEKRNSHAWQKLLKGNDTLTDYGSEVVLLGQFETSSWHVAPTSNGLILVDVLSNKATTTR